MTTTIVLFLITAGLFILLGGALFAIFQCIVVMNTMQYWWEKTITVINDKGEKLYFKYYSKELFVYNKDRNGDGKATWWELTFPNDGGHRIGIAMLYCFGLGVWFAFCPVLVIFDVNDWVIIGLTPIVPLLFWFLSSVGFTLDFDKYKQKP